MSLNKFVWQVPFARSFWIAGLAILAIITCAAQGWGREPTGGRSGGGYSSSGGGSSEGSRSSFGGRSDGGFQTRSLDRGPSFSRSDSAPAFRERPSLETSRSYSPSRSVESPRTFAESQPRFDRNVTPATAITPRTDSAFRSDIGAMRSRSIQRDSSPRAVSAIPTGELRERSTAASNNSASQIAQVRERLSGSDRASRTGGFDSGSASSDSGRSRSSGDSERLRSSGDSGRSKSSDSTTATKATGGSAGGTVKTGDRPSISDIRKKIGGDSEVKSTSKAGGAAVVKDPGGTSGVKTFPGMKDTGKIDTGKIGGKIDSGKIGGKIDTGKIGGKIDTGKIGGKVDIGKIGGKLPGGAASSTFPKITVKSGVGGMSEKIGKSSDRLIGKATPLDRVPQREFTALTSGVTAKKIDLSQQYQLAKQGDVARRMQLNKNVLNVTNVKNVANIKRTVNITHVTNVHQVLSHHPVYAHRGWVSPSYIRGGFFHSYWGSGYFPYSCWYPRWAPWLGWSWYYNCNPFWDPRPFWCRPVVYVASPAWGYWDVPVWYPLPVVSSGTWVNVERVVVEPQQYDLQLLAVRFVDPGHPDEKLGPRYRVWIRNNSDQAVDKPFDVTILASADGKLAAKLPQAGVRVTSIKAGETQSVDIRLPFDANKLGEVAEGKPAPIVTLNVLVDSNRAIRDVNRENNGAKLTNAEILPIDPAAFEADPKSVVAGKEIVVAGEGFGPEPGKVLVKLGGLEMEAEILGWYDLGVRLNVPNLPLAAETPADLIVVRGDGAAANPIRITVNPPALGQEPAAEPPAPAPAPPAPKLVPPEN
jgi:hypothetical protein